MLDDSGREEFYGNLEGKSCPRRLKSAVEAKEKDRTVALIIAILALLLALSEAGAKKAQHLSTEKNIEASDLFNFYQAKKIRSTVVETASKTLEAQKSALTEAKAEDAFAKQIGDFQTTAARFETDTKNPKTASTRSRNERRRLSKLASWRTAG